MKTDAILFLLAIHEGNELRDELPGDAYDELVIAGLLDGTEITDKGYAFVRHLEEVDIPVQIWVNPRTVAGNPDPHNEQLVRYIAAVDKALAHKREVMQQPVKVNIVMSEPVEPPAGYNPNPGAVPGGVDRASDISIIRANGKRKTLPAQAINWTDTTTSDRVVGWRYAPAGAEARIHTPGGTMPAPDV